MAGTPRAPRGTQDVLPGDVVKWQHIEQTAISVAADFGYREIRTPVFEHTELFSRSVGETTDVVQKEMYTFADKGGRSVTLRPEGTAGAARALLEHGLANGPLPVKVCYLSSCYRYEKPQAGRLREFHQFGAECFGAESPRADAEIIALARTLLQTLGLAGVSLRLNSIGCPACRAGYLKALTAYFTGHSESLCDTCRERLARNPMRILDCKVPACGAVSAGAPVMLDHLCPDCRAHFERVKGYLDEAEIPYTIDPHIVRGLDYYTRTVFEFVSEALGTGAVVCGGGRYDGLIEELGGAPLPSLGFGVGIERLLLALEAANASFPKEPVPEVYLAPVGEEAARWCFACALRLREGGVYVMTDLKDRAVKAQMKYADKIGARYVIVVGEDELARGRASLKDMAGGETREIALDDSLYTTLYRLSLDRQLSDMNRMLKDVIE